jgi:hypothetical protein
MNYYEVWQNKIEDSSDQSTYNDFVQQYYLLEKEAYDQILQSGESKWSGKAAGLAEKLGFADDMVIFAGFLDGIQTSLETRIDLTDLAEDTDLEFLIDFEKLYWNMNDAKAEWLYNLPSWDNVLSQERRSSIVKEYRTSKIVRREKIGRNDPCPCGSGKKFKNCCGKNQGAEL